MPVITRKYKHAIRYQGKVYVRDGVDLYRLPFESNAKHYGQKAVAKWVVNDIQLGFILGSARKSFDQIDAMTEPCECELKFYVPDATPF
jgi:hypothetical protein